MKRTISIVIASSIAFCAVSTIQGTDMKESDEVLILFKDALKAKGVSIKRVMEDGRFVVPLNGVDLEISLDNVRRDYLRDKDPGAVSRFVEAIVGSMKPMPEWRIARTRVFFSAEPGDHEFGDAVREKVTDTVTKVAVYVSEDERNIDWINQSELKKWGITKRELDE